MSTSGAKFDRSDMIKGFTLGMSRQFGKPVLANRPVFTISRPAPEYLPDTRLPQRPDQQASASASDAAAQGFGLAAGLAANDQAVNNVRSPTAADDGALDDFVAIVDNNAERHASGASAQASGVFCQSCRIEATITADTIVMPSKHGHALELCT